MQILKSINPVSFMNFKYPKVEKSNQSPTYDKIVIKIQKQHKIFGKFLEWMKEDCIHVWERTTVYKLESSEVYVDDLTPDESRRFIEGTKNRRNFDSFTSNILLGTINTDFSDEFASTIVEFLNNMPVTPASAGYSLHLYPIKFKLTDCQFIVGYVILFSEDSKRVLTLSVDNCYITRFWADPRKYKPGILYMIEEE